MEHSLYNASFFKKEEQMEQTPLKRPPVKDNLITTLNRMGYMLAKPDTFNQAFIDFATIVEAPVLEIGCAYGVATIPALEKGASVIANDLDERHLTLLKSYAPPSSLERLQLKPGRMPEDLDFPQESLGAVLASRVLNFVHPTKLEQSFHLIFKWLKKGGKFFYLGGSPWSGTYARFLPQYDHNKRKGIPWPGFIGNIKVYASPERAANLPQFVTLLDKDEVKNLMEQAGFKIQTLSYAAVDEENPPEMKLDGHEYIGAIGVKK
jgi:SAM-dependent methyltransferase